jgi:hypothetical protein
MSLREFSYRALSRAMPFRLLRVILPGCVGSSTQKTALDDAGSTLSMDRANLNVSCATQDVHADAFYVPVHLEINGVRTNAKALNPHRLD